MKFLGTRYFYGFWKALFGAKYIFLVSFFPYRVQTVEYKNCVYKKREFPKVLKGSLGLGS